MYRAPSEVQGFIRDSNMTLSVDIIGTMED